MTAYFSKNFFTPDYLQVFSSGFVCSLKPAENQLRAIICRAWVGGACRAMAEKNVETDVKNSRFAGF
jgi:hypothetical protein